VSDALAAARDTIEYYDVDANDFNIEQGTSKVITVDDIRDSFTHHFESAVHQKHIGMSVNVKQPHEESFTIEFGTGNVLRELLRHYPSYARYMRLVYRDRHRPWELHVG